MGWAGGSYVMSGIIRSAKKHVSAKHRKAFYVDVIKALEDADWDTQDECLGKDPVFDEALYEVHPSWRE